MTNEERREDLIHRIKSRKRNDLEAVLPSILENAGITPYAYQCCLELIKLADRLDEVWDNPEVSSEDKIKELRNGMQAMKNIYTQFQAVLVGGGLNN